MLISGLRKQTNLLEEILLALEGEKTIYTEDYDCESLIREVETNIRKLRRWLF